MKKTCGVCLQDFNTEDRRKTFCTKFCRQVFWTRKRKQTRIDNRIKVVCAVCSQEFKTYVSHKKFCSAPCALKARRERSRLQARKIRKKPKLKIVIFQPKICLDCKSVFETVHRNKVRCEQCQKFLRLVTHGGGPRRRCRYFGVPFEPVSPYLVFNRDEWKCKICGTSTPEEKRGTYFDDAPEVDHIWALSKIVGGVKSPGHVFSNCQCACRKCNSKKGCDGAIRGLAGTSGVVIDQYREIICRICATVCFKKSRMAVYCSRKCVDQARRDKQHEKETPILKQSTVLSFKKTKNKNRRQRKSRRFLLKYPNGMTDFKPMSSVGIIQRM
jgi:hypothetical protein